MSSYKIYNLLDLIDSVGEEKVQSILCDFYCPLNKEIEDFTVLKENNLFREMKKASPMAGSR